MTATARERVHLLGIRHHGPGSARSLRRALDELEPDLVLLELPADVEGALAWVGHEHLVPPVALLGHVRDEPRRAAFWPLATFSPEWQALTWAHERDRPVRCIDEPLAVSLATPSRDELRDPIAELAAVAGEPDPERWWDDVVEHRGEGVPAFEAIAEAMDALREGWQPAPGEARREAFMRRHLRAALAGPHARIAVVVGAWHVPALRQPLPTAAADAALVRGLSKVKAEVTWVPWTSRRLSAATGYGAGVASPAWYAHVFRHHDDPGHHDTVTRWFVEAGHLLRRRGLSASPDHLIAGARLADSLAALRERPRPGLAEVLDAAQAVLGEGGTAALQLVRDELVVGNDLGDVPDEVPLVPLARDLAAQQRRLRLRPTAEVRELELDLRSPLGLERSHLLHRTVALGLGWAMRADDRGSSGTFRETWRLRWEPELAVRLVELSVHGTTLVSAAVGALLDRVTSAVRLPDLVAVLERALLADLDEAVAPCVAALRVQAVRGTDTGELMDVLGPLAHAARYGDVRGTRPGALRSVLDAVVVRITSEVVGAASMLDDAAAATMAERLTAVQAGLVLLDHPARTAAWPAALGQVVSSPVVHGLVRGRATRLLHDAGRSSGEGVTHALGQALGPGVEPAVGAAFVEGFLAGSGTVLLHDADLLGVLDAWLAQLDAASFTTAVPLLRRTFGAFEPSERRQLGALVATGAPDAGPPGFADGGLDDERAARAMATVRQLLGVAS